MTQDRTPRLSTFVEPEITDARIARQWAAVEVRLPMGLGAPSRPWRIAMLGVPLMAAALIFALWAAPRTTPSGASVVESAESPIALRLHDGSSVELDAHTRLRVVREQKDTVEVALASGSARFDVAHVPGRRFSVSLGMATVNVVGTRFDVARVQRNEGTLVRVEVTRGIVEVRRRDQPDTVRRLTAGETWSALLPSAPVQVIKPVDAAEPVVEPKGELELAAAEGPEVEEFSLDDLDEVEESTAPVAGSKAGAAARARALFQRANVARRAGQMQEAADAYSELLQRHRRDARAGVSAFELGRIRMDALGDPKGAVTAFKRALVLAPSAGFREDALARIVIAYDALGQRAACVKARAGYLTKYPQGVHAGSVAARCR